MKENVDRSKLNNLTIKSLLVLRSGESPLSNVCHVTTAMNHYSNGTELGKRKLEDLMHGSCTMINLPTLRTLNKDQNTVRAE